MNFYQRMNRRIDYWRSPEGEAKIADNAVKAMQASLRWPAYAIAVLSSYLIIGGAEIPGLPNQDAMPIGWQFYNLLLCRSLSVGSIAYTGFRLGKVITRRLEQEDALLARRSTLRYYFGPHLRGPKPK